MDITSKIVGAITGSIFFIFFSFKTGTLDLNDDRKAFRLKLIRGLSVFYITYIGLQILFRKF